jgi:hypothetical protein
MAKVPASIGIAIRNIVFVTLSFTSFDMAASSGFCHFAWLTFSHTKARVLRRVDHDMGRELQWGA